MKQPLELLAPAGDMEKLKTAIHFGANAVYMAGKQYGLRAYSGNFSNNELQEAVAYAHAHGVKVYITLNIFAHNKDFQGLQAYLQTLEHAGVDAVIVSDLGVFTFVKQHTNLTIHISTQANTTNKYTAKMYADLGAKRIILARELTVEEIQEIRAYLPETIELECFVHGAMCISYSGRCLLSNYLTGRDSNHGECVQACRWSWQLTNVQGEKVPMYKVQERTKHADELSVTEDDYGTYIFNSKDMNLLAHLDILAQAGVTSFKIEGRMKSPYYTATVVNAYRRAINQLENLPSGASYTPDPTLMAELQKASHRQYTTGFTINNETVKQNYETCVQTQESVFTALVKDVKNDYIVVEMRNRFKVGDVLEILSPTALFGKTLTVQRMETMQGEMITDAKLVQQQLKIYTSLAPQFQVGDILRK